MMRHKLSTEENKHRIVWPLWTNMPLSCVTLSNCGQWMQDFIICLNKEEPGTACMNMFLKLRASKNFDVQGVLCFPRADQTF